MLHMMLHMRRSAKIALQVMALAALVHAPLGLGILCAATPADKPATAPSSPAVGAKPPPLRMVDNTRRAAGSADGLPAPVADMREAILAAVQAGSIDELRLPLSWNELPPDIADKQPDDPIAYWKQLSGDGQGREILAVLGRILDMPPARVAAGADVENNAVYVWPYLAEADLSALKPAQEVDLYRLVSPADAKVMRDRKRWTWWRLSIGADGTWHAFTRPE